MRPLIDIFGAQYPSFSLVLWIYFILVMIMVSSQCYIKYDIRYKYACKCVMVSAPFVAVGGKLLYGLTANEGYSLAGFIFGGTVFYGGLAGFCAGVFTYTKYSGQSFLKYMNFWAPYIALAQSFGRIGCLLNGCCYGKESESAIAIGYPADHPANGASLLPVPIMESVACLLLAIFLFRRKFDNYEQKGNFIIYLAAYAAIRFVLEFARGDEIRGIYWMFSTSQWISLGILISLAALFLKTKNSGDAREKQSEYFVRGKAKKTA